ncbi:MAG: CHAD domain-containing protein [Chloroflexota bacterium]
MAPARQIQNLSCDESFRSAAGKIIWTRFDEMMSFKAAAQLRKSSAGVHDMRVGSRRLRAALEAFQSAFPTKGLKPLLREIKALARVLGMVRDLDVMLQQLQKDVDSGTEDERVALRELITDLQSGRQAARTRLDVRLKHLDDIDFERRFLSFVARETM